MNVIAHDAGGKVKLRLPEGMDGFATFIGDRQQFRTHLVRWWGDLIERASAKYALWIGMNPSTADWNFNDPTVAREIKYTKDHLGLNRYIKMNVMDFRSTDPKALLSMRRDERCSPQNHSEILEYASKAEIVIAAWGSLPRVLRQHAIEVEEMLRQAGIKLHCVGYTQDGSPRHPLYVRGDAPLLPYPREAA
ncbi:MAG: DUF1643 domain-containing protein [Mesorhizobium sp.]|nr:MAG: DUF1643 domain-containing protein [Mesorhizobium sp.]